MTEYLETLIEFFGDTILWEFLFFQFGIYTADFLTGVIFLEYLTNQIIVATYYPATFASSIVSTYLEIVFFVNRKKFKSMSKGDHDD